MRRSPIFYPCLFPLAGSSGGPLFFVPARRNGKMDCRTNSLRLMLHRDPRRRASAAAALEGATMPRKQTRKGPQRAAQTTRQGSSQQILFANQLENLGLMLITAAQWSRQIATSQIGQMLQMQPGQFPLSGQTSAQPHASAAPARTAARARSQTGQGTHAPAQAVTGQAAGAEPITVTKLGSQGTRQRRGTGTRARQRKQASAGNASGATSIAATG